MIEKIPQNKPRISKNAFWDVDFEQIDFETKSLFVMEKVLNYGLWTDIVELIKFYGEQRIKDEIVKAPYLYKEVLNFICFYFNLSPKDFQCYNQRQSNNQLWNY